METTTDAPRLARSRRQRPEQDPAQIWAPLADLTEAAAATAGSQTVAITRGFDRNSRQRAKALRDLLSRRDVPAIEVTPAPGSDRLLTDVAIGAVVNLIGAGSWQPYRLAAQLRVPVLTPKPGPDAAEEATRDVIALVGEESGKRDVALSHVAVRGDNPADGRLTVSFDGTEEVVEGGWLTATVSGDQLEVQFGGEGRAEQSVTTSRIRVEASDTPHRLVRDELPIADFEGAVVLSAEAAGLKVRPV
ncbi:hypothetical protein EIL87_04850 [Saccharopolyspora rhizosphaerae]|uniref:Uncharacterized protein n=1 Tax=Saccharopolyspora rhizosphaerae TaxID=2492662 RepID=A0A426K1M2_9PSEU|nr:hypothetical protein [Saccharopolyspora rhizosphaerae]RRO19427.1 hypothetical protein EIL87_04850 [Saccharopolyspora rhizosphaerae]